MNQFILSLLSLIVFCQASCNEGINRQQSEKVKKLVFFRIIRENINEKEYLQALKMSFVSELDSILDVNKSNNRLRFTLWNKQVVIFEDHGNEDELEYEKYSYLGNLNRGFALFSVDGYEHNDLFLINMKYGTKTDLISFPYQNKTKTMFFTYSNNVEIGYFDNKVELYRVEDGSVIKLEDGLNNSELAPMEMYWISDDEAILKMFDTNKNSFSYEKWKLQG